MEGNFGKLLADFIRTPELGRRVKGTVMQGLVVEQLLLT